jgi:hypothetical protein
MIDQLDAELGVTPEDLAALKQIRRVWSRIEELKKKAVDTAGVKAYKTYMQKCLTQARAAKPVEDFDQLCVMGMEFRDHFDMEYHRLNIYHIESLRWPQPAWLWIQKHMPKEWDAVNAATKLWTDSPSRQTLDDAKRIVTKTLEDFVNATKVKD